MPRVEVIGIYPVEADEPVHLIEVAVYDVDAPFELGEFTQPTPDQPRSNWQVPYLERFLNASGDTVVAYYGDIHAKPELWRDEVRIAFFFHYLDVEQPLITPFGNVALPHESPLPARLSNIRYESP